LWTENNFNSYEKGSIPIDLANELLEEIKKRLGETSNETKKII